MTDWHSLQPWQWLISFRPSITVQQEVRTRAAAANSDWPFHRIENAATAGDVNLDFYGVRAETLPGGIDPSVVLTTMRRNLSSFVSSSLALFEPYADTDVTPWSDGDIGTLVSIEMRHDVPIEHGSVCLAERTERRWIFSTLWTSQDLGHPVSGNRAFGYMKSADGSVTFYTAGADRPTGPADLLGQSVVFGAADDLWRSFQSKLVTWITSPGLPDVAVTGPPGVAAALDPVHGAYYWNVIKHLYWRPSTAWLP